MPALPKALNKVGFSPRQAAVLQDIAGATLAQLVSTGFTGTQAKLLKAGGYDLKTLLVQGKFTRPQAQLILQA